MPKFAIYSTDISPTTDPANASPPPADLVVFYQDPLFGTYDIFAGDVGRGTVFKTLDGILIQDFGATEAGNIISISETDAFDQTTVDNLKTLWEAVDTQYYFTDGYNVWKIQFQRPNGFKYRPNLPLREANYVTYSYEINLVVISREI